MTHRPPQTSSRLPRFWPKGGWLWLGAIALVPAILLVVELARWRPLPAMAGNPLPTSDAVAAPRGEFDRQAESALAAIREWLSTRTVAGLEVCTGAAGDLLWCSSLGYADIEAGRRLTVDDSIRLGSVSKPVTSILLARYLERGLVDLDRPIGRILPDLPDHLGPVTLRQLASHTAGVRHYRWRLGWPPHETWSRVKYESVTASLAAFAGDLLLFPPGSDFAYSTHGYTLLGAVLERVGGAPFEEILDREIVGPLGLESTGLDFPESAPPAAREYEVLGRWYRKALAVDNSRAWPGAGLRSSAADLVRLVSGLPVASLIRSDTLELILTPQPLAGGAPNPENYALGWRLAQTREFLGGERSFRVAHHGGVSSGSSAFVAFFPDQSFAVAVLVNSRIGSGPLADLAFEVAEPFMARIVAEVGSEGM